MSNYNKKGERHSKLLSRKIINNHIKSFYNILHDMDTLAKQLNPLLDYNEDNINEYVNPIYGRDLDSMEKMLILGKIHYAKENNIKEH